jgi:hypothetical protein
VCFIDTLLTLFQFVESLPNDAAKPKARLNSAQGKCTQNQQIFADSEGCGIDAAEP